MNPRLVEPGFAVVCLHADVPARPGKDQDDETEAQGERQHVEEAGYLHGRACARPAVREGRAGDAERGIAVGRVVG
jgi:hypothetical protein